MDKMDENIPGLKRRNAERDLIPPTAGGKRRGKTLKRRKAELSQSGGQFVKDITIEERVSKIERDIASIKKQISDFRLSTQIGNRLRGDNRVLRETDKILLKKADILGIVYDKEKYANQNDFANFVNNSWEKYKKQDLLKSGGEKSKKNVKRKLTLKKKL